MRVGLRLGRYLSLTGHLNRGVDRVFEIGRVIRGRFVSIAEVHTIRARAHLAQSEPEMARDRFGFLERHGFVKLSSGRITADELAMLIARDVVIISVRHCWSLIELPW